MLKFKQVEVPSNHKYKKFHVYDETNCVTLGFVIVLKYDGSEYSHFEPEAYVKYLSIDRLKQIVEFAKSL